MSTLVQDLRYGLRWLAKNPGFSAIAILILALGIGAVFHWLNPVIMTVLILILGTALLPFYLQATCERILRHEFEQEYFRGVVNANHLEFPSVNQSLQDFELSADYSRLRTALKCDFWILTLLLRNAANVEQQYSREEPLLRLYFRLVFLSLVTRHRLRLREKPALLKLTAILQYFANVVGQRVDSGRLDNLTASELLLKL